MSVVSEWIKTARVRPTLSGERAEEPRSLTATVLDNGSVTIRLDADEDFCLAPKITVSMDQARMLGRWLTSIFAENAE